MKMWLYRVMELDDDGDPTDWAPYKLKLTNRHRPS